MGSVLQENCHAHVLIAASQQTKLRGLLFAGLFIYANRFKTLCSMSKKLILHARIDNISGFAKIALKMVVCMNCGFLYLSQK